MASSAFFLRSGDTARTGTDRSKQPAYLGGHVTKVYMDDAYFVVTVRYADYPTREAGIRRLCATHPRCTWERGEGNTTLEVWMPHNA